MSGAHGSGLPVFLVLVAISVLVIWYAVERVRESRRDDVWWRDRTALEEAVLQELPPQSVLGEADLERVVRWYAEVTELDEAVAERDVRSLLPRWSGA